MSISISINFDKEEKVYLPDEEVTGIIDLNINSIRTEKCLGLRVNLIGFAQNYYCYKSENSEGNTVERVKENYEEYYDISKFIWGDGVSSVQLSRCRSLHRFSFILPSNIPSSFGYKSGNLSCGVHHMIKAVLVFAASHNDIIHIEPISVIPMMNLNDCPRAKEDSVYEKRHSLWICCCPLLRIGSISFKIEFSSKGLVPGQNLIISGICYNNTLWNTSRTQVKLLQNVECKMKEASTVETSREVLRVDHDKIYPREVDNWNPLTLTIPPIPPTSLGGNCNIIKLKYMLEFAMKPNGCHTKLSKKVEIYIGMIPLYINFSSFRPSNDRGLLQPVTSRLQDTLNEKERLKVNEDSPLLSDYGCKEKAIGESSTASAPMMDFDNPPSYREATGGGQTYGFVVDGGPSYNLASTSSSVPPRTSSHLSSVVSDIKDTYPHLPAHTFKPCHFFDSYYPECKPYNVPEEEFAAGSHNKLHYAPKFIFYET